MDLDAVRTFVAAADTGQFSEAAAELAITQQAVSKRIAALEKDLGVRLFTRTARGTRLTIDGQAFLPRARDLLQAAERAAASVRPGRRALRVDVIGRRLAPAELLRGFHRAHPGTELDVVTLFDAAAAVDAVRSGTIDASFRAVTTRGGQLPGGSPEERGISTARVLDEPIELVTGPGHKLATARAVSPDQLAGHRIWMPGIVTGTEWAAFYEELAAEFGLTIDATGPNFGVEPLLDVIADSPALATFVGGQTRLLWPADYDLRRIPVRDPVPVYPHSLIWRRDNPHPGLATLRAYLTATPPAPPAQPAPPGQPAQPGRPAPLGQPRPSHTATSPAGTWTPAWARQPA